jgi:hypothetical protein
MWADYRNRGFSARVDLATAMNALRVLAIAAVFMAAACSTSGGTTGTTPSGSPVANPSNQPANTPTPRPPNGLDPEVPMPSDFPADIPIYPGARLTSASHSGVRWSMVWETLDSGDNVVPFYGLKLQQQDWTVTLGSGSDGLYNWTFHRVSDSNAGGSVVVDATSGVTKISMSYFQSA